MATARDPATGLPILGQTDPAAEGEQRVQVTLNEKRTLAADDHDWMVVIFYHIGEGDSARAAEAGRTGVAANPPIMLANQLIRGNDGPVCARCQQDYSASPYPCPGMPFEQYLAQMPDDVRAQFIERMTGGDLPEGAKFDLDEKTGVVTITDGDEIVEVIASADVAANAETRVMGPPSPILTVTNEG